jgi:hypothetical protein
MTRSIHALLFLCIATMANAQTDERSVSIASTSDTVQVGEAFTITLTIKGATDNIELIEQPDLPYLSRPSTRHTRKWLNGDRTEENIYTVEVLALRPGIVEAPSVIVIWEGDERRHEYARKPIVVVGTAPASEEQILFRHRKERPEGTRMVQYHDGKGFLTERKDGRDELLRYLRPKEVKRLEKLLR